MSAPVTGPRTFHAVDPRTGEPGPEVAEASAADVRAAVAAAAAAAADPRLRDHARRAALLRAAARRLRAVAGELLPVVEAETGLDRARLDGELGRTTGQLELFAGVVEDGVHVEAMLDRPGAGRPDVRRMLVPVGPVAVFGASNFPLAFSVAGGDTASALAAGCPVLVKGHPAHPGTSAVVARELTAAVAEAGLPEGTFALLQSAGQEVGELLVDAPEVAAVAFTGSLRAGRALFDRAAARPAPIPVFAEMGSVNPFVVTDAALARRGDAIAAGLATAVTGSGGQLCTKPGLAFVPAGPRGDALAAAVTERLDALEPPVLLTERLRDALAGSVDELAEAPAVERLTAPRDPDGPGLRFPAAAFSAPAAALLEDPGLLEERFGPVVLLLRYGGEEELLAALEAVPGQLSAALHADPEADGPLAARLVEVLGARAGRLVFDGFTTGVAVTHAMQHGGPYPATTAPGTTSVGTTAAKRFLRPLAFQDAPAALLPPELRDENPLGVWRVVDGVPSRDAL